MARVRRELERARSEDWQERYTAARCLARHLENRAAFHELVRLLSDGDTAVIAAAAEGLVERGGEEGVSRVLAVLAEGPDDVGYHLRDALVSLWLAGARLQEISRRILADSESASARAGAAEILQILSEEESGD